jgi:hypothetical protein
VNTAMPRPKGSKNKPKPKQTQAMIAKQIDDNTQIACSRCAKLKAKKHFYQSIDNPMHPTGRVPYCKDCLKLMISDTKGKVDINKVYDALQKIDRPFLYDLFVVSMNGHFNDKFGEYVKNLQMVQYRSLTWKDSIFQPKATLNYDGVNSNDDVGIKKNINVDNKSYGENRVSSGKIIDFIVTDAVIDKWGCGYTDEEYFYFEKKWKKLIDNYGEKTSLHVEGLITYIRFRVKEELSTADGDVREAKEWAAMAKQAAQDAKLNVAQLSKSDISGGVELLPQIFEAVEAKVGIISIMPKLKAQPYDDVDLIIWCVVNYIRRLEGKSRIKYKDVWNFYDDMLVAHYNSQGYTKEQIKKEREKRNNIFRDLGAVYKEPIYEEGVE